MDGVLMQNQVFLDDILNLVRLKDGEKDLIDLDGPVSIFRGKDDGHYISSGKYYRPFTDADYNYLTRHVKRK